MKNKIVLFVLSIVCCFALCSCGEDDKKVADLKIYEAENFETQTIENEALNVTVDGNTTEIIVTDKKTGKVYRSNPSKEDLEKYEPNTKGLYKNVLSSTLSLTYSNKNGTDKELENFSKCISNKNFNIEKKSDSEIVVRYSVGDFEKTYVCPIAIKKSQMDKWIAKMDSSNKRAVTQRYYTLYDYEELSGEDGDADQLQKALAIFPDLKDEPIYYLMDDITADKLENCEEIFKKYGYTDDDRIKDMGDYKVSRNEGKAVFNISVHYILDQGQLVVKAPMSEIQYNETFPIVKLQLLPYFGAASTGDKGYMIVPEGTGGLIKFNNGKIGQQIYQGEVYGWDYCNNRTQIIDETRASFPLFGMVNENNKSSFLCVAEEGSAYSTVTADISGKRNHYNYATFVYKMVHSESYEVSSKSDTAVHVYEENLPNENISQRYIFSDDTDYTKLAGVYRDYLIAKNPSLKKKAESKLPFAVEMIGAVEDTEHILGYPVVRSQSLTSYSQAKNILQSLMNSGVKNIDAKYTGWFNTGVKQGSAAHVDTVSRLGGDSDLEDLTKFANDTDGLNLYLNGTFQFIYRNDWFDGFTENSNSAKFCSREIAELYNLDAVTFQTNEKYMDAIDAGTYFLAKPSYVIDNITHYADVISEDFSQKNIGFEDIGYKLAGDYNPRNRVSREASMKLQAEKLKKLKEDSGRRIMITSGNQYAVPYSDFITDMSIDTKKVNIVDETIPFYQAALHGLVDYTSTAINLSSNQEENILKSAETGAGLYYTFISEPSSVLQDGKYTKYYACNFDDWKEDTVNLYNKFNEELGDIYNQYIVGHKQIAEGLYETTYENGKKVVVNYNFTDCDYNGTVVPKRSFISTKGGE